MNQFDSNKDYYDVLGVDKDASQAEIDRQYRREASKHHPDRGGNEEQMKSLNEAYRVLRNAGVRRSYDDAREPPRRAAFDFTPVSTPTAQDVGALGHCLSALLCLAAGVFLLMLVRFQWIMFLWPLAIIAVFVTGFGVVLARSAMIAVNDSLPVTNPFKRHTRIQEVAFWTVIATGGYGLYLVLTY
jgi:DnaJ-like protein